MHGELLGDPSRGRLVCIHVSRLSGQWEVASHSHALSSGLHEPSWLLHQSLNGQHCFVGLPCLTVVLDVCLFPVPPCPLPIRTRLLSTPTPPLFPFPRSKAQTGSGLPAGPAGLLGAVEGFSYLSLLAGIVVFGLQAAGL